MTRKTRIRLNNVKTFAVLLFAAVFALLALPLPVFGAQRKVTAEVETAEADSTGGGVYTSATADVALTVYYYDKTGGYDGYNMWVWEMPNGNGEKHAHDFAEGTVEVEGYPGKQWKKFTYTLKNVDTSLEKAIGLIVRKGDWEEKTPDMHVDGSKIKDNKVSVYLVKGSTNVYYTAEDAMSNKITAAFFNKLDRVYIETSAAITDKSIFKVKDETGAVLGTLNCADAANKDVVGSTAANITLDTGKEVSFASNKRYTVVDEPETKFDGDINFVGMSVAVSGLYDMDVFKSYEYDGTLGAEYTKEKTTFTVWSPSAVTMKVKIYETGESETGTEYDMALVKGEKGAWTTDIEQDLDGKYYTYLVGDGTSEREIVDPYARSAGRDGKRGMILDLAKTNPEGWANHKRPDARGSYSNAIIYEAHIRDLTMDKSSNVSDDHKGKFLGLTETSADPEKSTPLDYIKALGVTELHILPMFDFASVKETFNKATYQETYEDEAERQYNWGYDPLNYNVPEGSYSTDPANGEVRVKELKQMIMALHAAGIRVIMDVVYNHVSDATGSNFQALMPNYYFRTNADGSFTNGSGCGNDTASERAMYRKFMVESVNYWADEYKIDGFRFDLMGLHDHVTMNKIYDTLAEKNPDIMIYGEGWVMGTMEETEDLKAANMYNAKYMPNIAFFDDGTRDTLKGGGFGMKIDAKGFIEGNKNDGAVYMGALGGTDVKPSIFSKAGKRTFAANPTQNINYVSCHDNSTLWDKINASAKGSNLDTKKAMNRLAATAVLTSQGPAFFLAGEEMLRTKPTTEENKFDNRPEKWADEDYYFADNSYKSPDSVNAIDWTLATTNADMVDFYKQLIQLKKNSPMFRISTKDKLAECLTIVDTKLVDGMTSYAVKDPDSNEYAVVLFNATDKAADIQIPQATYSVYVNGDKANATQALSTFTGNSFNVGAFSAVVMKSNDITADKLTEWNNEVNPSETPDTPDKPSTDPAKGDDKDDSNLGLALGLGIGIPAAVLIAGGVVFGVMYSKKKKSAKPAGSSDSPEASDTPPEEN